jgi:hypothetical protein
LKQKVIFTQLNLGRQDNEKIFSLSAGTGLFNTHTANLRDGA